MSHLWWVPVPAGSTEHGAGVLRLLVIPVLDRTLAESGLSTWPPDRLTQPDALLSVDVCTALTDGQPSGVTTRSAKPTVRAVPGAWEQFFGRVQVRVPGEPPVRDVDVTPTSAHARQVEDAYFATARALTSEDDPGALGRAALAAAESAVRNSVRRAPRTLRTAVSRNAPRRSVGAASNGPDAVDFNLAVGLLREHPAVLSALGLVIELEIEADELPLLPAEGFLRVGWAAAPADFPAIRPRWVAYQRDPFAVRAQDPRGLLRGGMLALNRPSDRWQMLMIDPEQALGGLGEAARGAVTHGLPSLRTAGLLLTHPGRQVHLDSRSLASQRARGAADAAEQAPLYAEDLVLGVRVDVKASDDHEWRSLTARTASYTVNDVLPLVQDQPEEGHVKLTSGTDDGSQTFQTSEVVARWDGWSLAVPRPAMSPAAEAIPPGPEATLPFRLRPDFTVADFSLPRLRFGQRYQMRARVVDVTGGGPPLDAQSPDECDLDPRRFTRHEPVLPPDVARAPGDRAPYGTGASLLTLVLREPGDGDPAGPATDADTKRLLTRPSTSLDVVERHQALDGRTAAETLPLVTRPRIADPAAGGAVLFVRGMPGEPAQDYEQEPWDAWPDDQPKTLVLQPRTNMNQPTVATAAGHFVVRLAPAEEATVEVSSMIVEGALHNFAVSDWIQGTGHDAARVDGAQQLLDTGRHPMATPPTFVRVRHAVRQPRSRPSGAPKADRPERATYADLSGKAQDLGVDPASTVTVEVSASWTPAEDPETAVTDRPVGRIEVERGDTVLRPLRHELGDTKHRRVTYSARAVSRFRDCYPDGGDDGAVDRFTISGTWGPVDLLSTAAPPLPMVRSVVPGFTWKEQTSLGHVMSWHHLRLGQRLRVQLGPWFATGDGERLAVIVDAAGAGATWTGPTTQLGRDPVWQSDPVDRHHPIRGDVSLVTMPDGSTATAVLVTPWRSGNDWYADIVFEPISAYGALAQLVLARHQPWSLSHAIETSPVVVADFAPVLPDRDLAVVWWDPESTLFDQAVFVSLSGTGPVGPRTNRVDVVLEQRLSGALPDGQPATVGEDGLWLPVGSASGGLGDDLRVLRVDGDVRLRVREVERFDQPGGGASELADRVVFADVVVPTFGPVVA